MDQEFEIEYNDQTRGHILVLLILTSLIGRYSFLNLLLHSLLEPHRKQYSFVLGFFSHPVGLFYNRVRQGFEVIAKYTNDMPKNMQELTKLSFMLVFF